MQQYSHHVWRYASRIAQGSHPKSTASADASSRSKTSVYGMRRTRLLSVLPCAMLCWRVIGKTCRRHLHAERDTRRRMPDGQNPHGTVPADRTGHRPIGRQKHRRVPGCLTSRRSSKVPQKDQDGITADTWVNAKWHDGSVCVKCKSSTQNFTL